MWLSGRERQQVQDDPEDERVPADGRRSRQAEIEHLVSPAIRALDCELWGTELSTRGRNSLLRIYIDREDGVSIEDCEAVSRQVGRLLDVEEPISGNYTLEVSSPGMDRILFRIEHYALYIGETVDVRLVRPFEGRRRLTGTLAGVDGDEVRVQVDDEEFILPLEWIQRTRVVPRFE